MRTLKNSADLMGVLIKKTIGNELYPIDPNPDARTVAFKGNKILVSTVIKDRGTRKQLLGFIRDYITSHFNNEIVDNTKKSGRSDDWYIAVKFPNGKSCRIIAKHIQDKAKGMLAKDYINSSLAKSEVIEFMKGEMPVKISCWVYDDPEVLKKAVLDNIEKKDVLPELHRNAIKDLFKNYMLESDNLKKASSVLIYFGEVFYPWLILAGKEKLCTEGYTECKVYFPKSDSFSTFDSIIKFTKATGEEDFFKVSNKFDKGSAASIWKVFEVVKFNYGDSEIPNCLIKDLMRYYEKNKKSALHTVWDFYLNERWHLNLDGKESYLSCKVGKVPQSIHDKCPQEVLENKNYPNNLTYYFDSSLAAELREDQLSLNIIKNALFSEDIYQVNISHISAAKTGKFAYNIEKSTSNMKLTIVGTKSSQNDITAKQGTINYRFG